MKIANKTFLLLCLTTCITRTMEHEDKELESVNLREGDEEQFIDICSKLFRDSGDCAVFKSKHFINVNINLINAQKSNGLTALDLAILHCQPKIVKYLIDKGADIKQTLESAIGEFELRSDKIAKTKYLKIVKYLLLSDANPNILDRWGNSMLSYGLMTYDVDIACALIMLLVKHGANVNLEFGLPESGYEGLYYLHTFNKGKIKPLKFARKKNLPKKIIDCLIELGAED